MPASDDTMNTGPQDWALCGTDSSRRAVLKESTFVLAFAPSTIDFVSTTLLQARIYEALRSGKCVLGIFYFIKIFSLCSTVESGD